MKRYDSKYLFYSYFSLNLLINSFTLPDEKEDLLVHLKPCHFFIISLYECD